MKIAIFLDLDNIKPELEELENLFLLDKELQWKIVARWAFANNPAVQTVYGRKFRKYRYHLEITPARDPQPQEVDHLIFQSVDGIIENQKLGVEAIAIVSNDGDFASLFEKLEEKSIYTIAIGTQQMSKRLKDKASKHIILDNNFYPLYLGIDLGTTNTVMAIASLSPYTKKWTCNQVEITVPNESSALEKKALIPSSVRFTKDKKVEIGHHIRKEYAAFRSQTVLAWKHDMGICNDGIPFFYDLEKLDPSDGNHYPKYLQNFYEKGKVYPEECASGLLSYCRHELLTSYPQVAGVVITHPASYESDAVQATKKAAILAGWHEDEVVTLPEPHAALYDFLYRLENGEIADPIGFSEKKNILVYDLGGGTLDVSLQTIIWNQNLGRFFVKEIANGDRTRVGGDEADRLLTEYVMELFASQLESFSEEKRETFRAELYHYAGKFKKLWGHKYSFSEEGENFSINFQGNFLESQVPVRIPINKKKYQDILKNILRPDLSLDNVYDMDLKTAFDSEIFTDPMQKNTFVVPVIDLLLKARKNMESLPKIHGVLLNGGMTYFPLVRERLEKLFQNIPLLSHNSPDIAVARGAALYAAGIQGNTVQRVCSNNIYLEVEENNQISLRHLVAQGQKYPYKTTLYGFKLPDEQNARLLFKIWFGMGSCPGKNTTLQRFRKIDMAEIHKANLSSSSQLNLQVQYTIDERLILTLLDQEGDGQFELELIGNDEADENVEKVGNTLDLPEIQRDRSYQPSEKYTIDYESWRELMKVYLDIPRPGIQNTNNSLYNKKIRDLIKETAMADNRLPLLDVFWNWHCASDTKRPTSHQVRFREITAIKLYQEIFSKFSKGDKRITKLENRFQIWAEDCLRILSRSNIDKAFVSTLLNAMANLMWEGSEEILRLTYKNFRLEKFSHQFLISLGKLGNPCEKNLNLLLDILKNHKFLNHREAAVWAIGRLYSPYQSKNFKAKLSEIESILSQLLVIVTNVERDMRVLVSVIGAIYQLLAWSRLGCKFSENIVSTIKDPNMLVLLERLPSAKQYPKIFDSIKKRIILLPKILEIDKLTTAEKEEIKEVLLKVYEL